MTFPKIITDLFTEKDGITWDFIKIMGTGGIVWWMSTQSVDVYKGHTFNPMDTAMGLASLIIAVGTGVALRRVSNDSTSPEKGNDDHDT